ncbi:MAG TPA: hypothetical protein PL041_06075, partial [Melioribacteraceae bacterium]|nr:hypothetical protein [Melioribacteraceae bacterium]
IKHGENEVDESGNLIFNYGGSYSVSTTTILSSSSPKLLDGILNIKNRLSFSTKYFFSYLVNFNLIFTYEERKVKGNKFYNNQFNFIINYNLF